MYTVLWLPLQEVKQVYEVKYTILFTCFVWFVVQTFLDLNNLLMSYVINNLFTITLFLQWNPWRELLQEICIFFVKSDLDDGDQGHRNGGKIRTSKAPDQPLILTF